MDLNELTKILKLTNNNFLKTLDFGNFVLYINKLTILLQYIDFQTYLMTKLTFISQ